VTDWKALADEDEARNVREYEERQARRERLKAAGLDLDDPMVRKMADLRHTPNEIWTLGGDVWVCCSACHKSWPCEVRQALRDSEQED
jgi:hypothetical protein